MRKKFMFPFICLLVGMNMLYGEWNTWDTPPKQGDLYMHVMLFPWERPEERQLLIITRFDPENPQYESWDNGWWTVDKDTVWKWLNEGSRLIYEP